MTYKELLEITAEKKRKAVMEINDALHGDAGFLTKAIIQKDHGGIAWQFLAREFCETIAEHMSEILDEFDVDSIDAREIYDIYVAYEDGDEDLYELLPTEARLFD